VRGKAQRERFSLAPGASELVRRQDGQGVLLVTVGLPEGTPMAPPEFIGVDFGVVNLATDNDGEVYTHPETAKGRQQQNQVSRSLGRKAGKGTRAGARPKNSKRKLKARSGKERRFKANENHRISKRTAREATATGRGIGLEELTGVRERTRFRKAGARPEVEMVVRRTARIHRRSGELGGSSGGSG